MLWLTNVNPTFNKGTLKKCWDLEWEVGRGGGRRRCRKRRAYLWKNPGYAPACVVQKWRTTPVFRTRGLCNYSSDVFRVVVEDTPKFVRIRSDSLRSEAMNGSCNFMGGVPWIVFNTLQQQSLIASLEMRSLLLVAVWRLQKDVNVFSTKGKVSRNSDLKNIPAAVTCT